MIRAMLRQTVLTNATAAYVSVGFDDRASKEIGDDLTIPGGDTFWNRASSSLAAISGPDLTLQSLGVKDYAHSPVLVLVYTAESFMSHGPFVYTVVRFFSDTSTATFIHAALQANPANGADGLDAVARSFRFGG